MSFEEELARGLAAAERERRAEVAVAAARKVAATPLPAAEPVAESSEKHPGYKECPGCSRTVLAHLLACRRCWANLPRVQRERVVRAYRRDSLVLSMAVVEAVDWWRAHNRSGTGR